AHPAFSFANPNRVRALIGAFAQGNQTQFNRADGAGYEFLAQTVVDLDAKNPQVAARLLSAFKSWRALEATRRGKAEAVLRRIAALGTLSRDAKDIVTRMTEDGGRRTEDGGRTTEDGRRRANQSKTRTPSARGRAPRGNT